MRRSFILSVFLSWVCFYAQAQQTVQGTWYALGIDPSIQVAQLDFSSARLSFEALDWNLKETGLDAGSQIVKSVQHRNKLYVLVRSEADSAHIRVAVLKRIMSDNMLRQEMITARHNEFEGLAEALAFVAADSLDRPVVAYFPDTMLMRLKTLPDALGMNRDQFKNYLTRLLIDRQQLQQYMLGHPMEIDTYSIMAYFASEIRNTLASLGFNPLISDDQLGELGKNFKGDANLVPLALQVRDLSVALKELAKTQNNEE